MLKAIIVRVLGICIAGIALVSSIFTILGTSLPSLWPNFVSQILEPINNRISPYQPLVIAALLVLQLFSVLKIANARTLLKTSKIDVIRLSRDHVDIKDKFHLLISTSTTIDVLGISNDRFCAEASYEMFENISKKPGSRIRMLFLSPVSRFVQAREVDESRPLGFIATRINHSLQDIDKIKEDIADNFSKDDLIEVYLYDSYPICNITIFDDRLVIVHYYNFGLKGPINPCFIVDEDNLRLLKFFKEEFKLIWARRLPKEDVL